MELYIAKKNESLNDIAMKFNLTFEELVQFNKTYRNRLDLEDCPVLIPTYNRTSGTVFLPNYIKNNLPILEQLISKYNHLLKEYIMSLIYIEGYEKEIKEGLIDVEKNIKNLISKNKTKDVTKITSSLEYKGLIDTVEGFIKSIKEHELEMLKRELRNFKNISKKVSLLYSDDLLREESLAKHFKEVFASWRDYILNLATKEFNLAEDNFNKILNKGLEIAKELI